MIRKLISKILARIYWRGHYLDCRLSTWLQRRHEKRWLDRWPNYCGGCNGWGGRHSYSYSYSYYEPEPNDFDYCDATASEQVCHRCGEIGLQPETAEGPCIWCGWDYDDGLAESIGCEGACEWRRGQRRRPNGALS